MRLRDTIICILSLVLAASLLFTAGSQLDYINAHRYRMKLTIYEPLKNAPPSLAFATVAMGAFRGLVVDILWMRADRLKDQGQFFDARQLAEWITTLQPRFGAVWEFHAWNMAYNISVTIPASQPDQRWRWVKNGYELLRDQGIPLNPRCIELYRELSRIFHHKIGAVSDDAHEYYKLQLALAMQPLLDEGDEEHFKALAEAPETWDRTTSDPNVAELIKALKAADNTFTDKSDFTGNYLALRQNPDKFEPAAFQVIDRFRGSKALKKFDIFAKAYQLRNVWKLDPLMMQHVNETYGPVEFDDPNKHLPLDWRHPSSHAIYWAVRGLQVAGKDEFSIEEAHTDRIVFHSLQNLFRNGKIFIYSYKPSPDELADHSSPLIKMQGKRLFLRPDLRMFDSYNRVVLASIEKYRTIQPSTATSMQTGHKNMLRNAVLSFYQAGHRKAAQRTYDQLRTLYPLPDFQVPMVVYVRNRLGEELKDMGLHNAQEMVHTILRESYFRYALRDDDEAYALEKLAKEAYDRYQSMYPDDQRIDLPKFELMRYTSLQDFFGDTGYPLGLRQTLIDRIKIEKPELARKFEEIEKKLVEKVEKRQRDTSDGEE